MTMYGMQSIVQDTGHTGCDKIQVTQVVTQVVTRMHETLLAVHKADLCRQTQCC